MTKKNKIVKKEREKKKIKARRVEAKEPITREKAFSLFDALDDDQIVRNLAGEVISAYVYRITVKDEYGNPKEIIQLSKTGVDMACRELAKRGEIIRELEMTYQDAGEDALFFGKCARFKIDKNGRDVLLDTKICQKLQSKNYHTRDGRSFPNKFWFEHGGQKCMRNGRRDLIPADLIAKLIRKWIEAGQFIKINEKQIPAQSGSGQTKPYAKKEEARPVQKAILPDKVELSTICNILGFKERPRKYSELSLQDLFYIRDNTENPEKLDLIIDIKMSDLYEKYDQLLSDYKVSVRGMIKGRYGVGDWDDLDPDKRIELLREMKKVYSYHKKQEEAK